MRFYKRQVNREVAALERIAQNIRWAHSQYEDADSPELPLMEAAWVNGLPNPKRGQEVKAA